MQRTVAVDELRTCPRFGHAPQSQPGPASQSLAPPNPLDRNQLTSSSASQLGRQAWPPVPRFPAQRRPLTDWPATPIALTIDLAIFLATPRSPRQRGSNVSANDCAAVAAEPNDRARKILNWLTPKETPTDERPKDCAATTPERLLDPLPAISA